MTSEDAREGRGGGGEVPEEGFTATFESGDADASAADPVLFDPVASDCRAALILLDRLEAMVAAGWLLAAVAQMGFLNRLLAGSLLASRGPQPGLADWIQGERPEVEAEMSRRELRAALNAGDIVRAILALSDLRCRLASALRGDVE